MSTTERAQIVLHRAHSRTDLATETTRALVGAVDDYVVQWEWWRYAVGAGAAYHGYMRNRSWLWSIGWYVAGFMMPLITVPVAVAQYVTEGGYKKRK